MTSSLVTVPRSPGPRLLSGPTRLVLRGRGLSGSPGFATAELAMALPALCLLVGVMVSMMGAVAAQVRCVDAARAGARAAARGDTLDAVNASIAVTAPHGARVTVSDGAGPSASDVSVTVRAQVGGFRALGLPGISVHASAVAAREDVAP